MKDDQNEAPERCLLNGVKNQGRIQDFKLGGGGGGGGLKKIASSGGRRGNFWGISCEKSYVFQFKGGANFRGDPPLCLKNPVYDIRRHHAQYNSWT